MHGFRIVGHQVRTPRLACSALLEDDKRKALPPRIYMHMRLRGTQSRA
jgi:hypothetical protein